jgi:hypothetical protein
MLRSGYLLESRVSAMLRNRSWIVESNSAYMDYGTGKTRELDVHAIGGSSIYDDERGVALVFQHLLIECVHPPQPIVFIKSDSLLNEKKVELIKDVSSPPFMWDGEYWHRLPSFLKLERFHHYACVPIASQFCSFSRKNNEGRAWMAIHEDSQYAAFVALGQAVEFHLAELQRPNGRRSRRPAQIFPPHIELFYPIFVVEGEIWSVDQTQDAPEPQNVDLVNYRHSTFVNGIIEEFIVSVVTERYFQKFAARLESECDKIAACIRDRLKDFESAQKRISEMRDAELAKLPVTVSPHLARIVASTIITRERQRRAKPSTKKARP